MPFFSNRPPKGQSRASSANSNNTRVVLPLVAEQSNRAALSRQNSGTHRSPESSQRSTHGLELSGREGDRPSSSSSRAMHVTAPFSGARPRNGADFSDSSTLSPAAAALLSVARASSYSASPATSFRDSPQRRQEVPRPPPRTPVLAAAPPPTSRPPSHSPSRDASFRLADEPTSVAADPSFKLVPALVKGKFSTKDLPPPPFARFPVNGSRISDQSSPVGSDADVTRMTALVARLGRLRAAPSPIAAPATEEKVDHFENVGHSPTTTASGEWSKTFAKERWPTKEEMEAIERAEEQDDDDDVTVRGADSDDDAAGESGGGGSGSGGPSPRAVSPATVLPPIASASTSPADLRLTANWRNPLSAVDLNNASPNRLETSTSVTSTSADSDADFPFVKVRMDGGKTVSDAATYDGTPTTASPPAAARSAGAPPTSPTASWSSAPPAAPPFSLRQESAACAQRSPRSTGLTTTHVRNISVGSVTGDSNFLAPAGECASLSASMRRAGVNENVDNAIALMEQASQELNTSRRGRPAAINFVM